VLNTVYKDIIINREEMRLVPIRYKFEQILQQVEVIREILYIPRKNDVIEMEIIHE